MNDPSWKQPPQPEDEDVDFAPFVRVVRRRAVTVLVIATLLACVTGLAELLWPGAVVEHRAAQSVRFVFQKGIELVGGGELRTSDFVDRQLLRRVYDEQGLSAFLPFESFQTQVDLVGVSSRTGEYELRYTARPEAVVPPDRVHAVLRAILAAWGRGVQTARFELGDGSMWRADPFEAATDESVIVRTDAARRQVMAFTDRLRLVPGHYPSSVPSTSGSLVDVSTRIDDARQGTLEPLMLVICRSTQLSATDRLFLDARALQSRMSHAGALTALNQLGQPRPEDTRKIAEVAKARALVVRLEQEVMFYAALVEAAKAPRVDSRVDVNAGLSAFVESVRQEAKAADVLARTQLARGATLEGSLYFLGDFRQTVWRQNAPDRALGRAVAVLLGMIVIGLLACGVETWRSVGVGSEPRR